MSRTPECLFVWTRTNSLMGESTWPFYGSLAVATYASKAGAGVQIFDRRNQKSQDDFENMVKKASIVLVGADTSDIPDTLQVIKTANRYKKPVIVGGVHPTAIDDPKSEFRNATSIVKGDGTSVIEEVIKDWKTGHLKSIYNGIRPSQEVALQLDRALPNRKLMPNEGNDHQNSLVTEIGCPNTCIFCFDNQTGTSRRNPNKVSEEISLMAGDRPLFANFDDNIIGNDPEGAVKLAESVIRSGLKPRWFGNADITSILHLDVLAKLREAGMGSIYLGFESIYSETLRFAGKLNLIRKVYDSGLFGDSPKILTDEHVERLYKHAVEILHKMGFTVYCGLICGWPNETETQLEGLINFARNVPDMPWLSIATPYPGTAFSRYIDKRKMKIKEYKTGEYDTNHFVFMHPKIKNDYYYRMIKSFYQEMGSDEIVKRKLKILKGSMFDVWAVESVRNSLVEQKEKASILYKDY